MRISRFQKKKELEIVSLIDVVFLLIIFGIVISVFNRVGLEPEENGRGGITIEIKRQGEITDKNEFPRLIVKIDKPGGRNLGYDSAFFPVDARIDDLDWKGFSSCDACQLIHDRIAYYADSLVVDDPQKFADQIYVKASRDTKFRIISFIMEQCSAHRPKLPSVKVMML
jgi:hypothetical protein